MSKRRVRLPGRFADENRWYVIRFSADNELSPPVKSNQLEDVETGETGEEKVFKIGDNVQAPWTDGIMYHGEIEFESETKEDCLKYKESKKKTKKRRKVDKTSGNSELSADAEDAALKKKKKEKNEKKKKIESARQQTAMATAEELFKSSLLTPSHDCTSNASSTCGNIEVSSLPTSSSATSCTVTASTITSMSLSSSHLESPDYEPAISPAKSSLLQSQSSQACSVDQFNRGLEFPPPFHPLPSFYYPVYHPNQNPYPVLPNSSMMNVPPPPKLNSSTSLYCPPSQSDSSTHLLNLMSGTPCSVDNDCDGRSNIPSASDDVPACPTTSSQSQSTSFLSALSDNGCGDCVLKDTELASCREFQRQQERDISFWKSEALKLSEKLKEKNLAKEPPSANNQNDHYLPKRGICIEKCCYVVAENPDTFSIPRGYVKFVEGHDIYIDSKWMTSVKSLFRGKTKPHCLKLIMNGFYEPNDLQKKTAMVLFQTPLGQALKAFAITILGMDNTDIVKAINTKIGTMNRAVKENRLSKGQDQNTKFT